MARTVRCHNQFFNTEGFDDNFKTLFKRGKIKLCLLEGWFRNNAYGWKYEDVWSARAKRSIKKMLRRRDRKVAKIILRNEDY